MGYEFERIYKGSEEFPIGIFSQNCYLPEAHHHIEYEIFYLEEGDINFGIENYEINIHGGDVLFIPPLTNHYVKKIPEQKPYHYYAIVFDTSVLGPDNDSIRILFESIRASRYLKLSDEILEKIKESAVVEKEQSFGREIIIKSLLFEIISYIIKTNQYVEISNIEKYNVNGSVNAVDAALEYIHAHYKEQITMDDVLNTSTYSKSHFIRLFKKYVGLNLTDYINKYRIEKSCLDLIYTNKNVTEIATENGFNTVQYFSKIFKTYMNCTPKKYKKNGQNIIIPSTVSSIK